MKKTRIAKTSKFFLFFPLSEKYSPPFPNARWVVPAKESFLFALQTQAWLWDLLPSVPLGANLYTCCLFGFVFIFPAHWKQGLFLFKINFGSETLFLLNPALPPYKPSGIFREDSKNSLCNTIFFLHINNEYYCTSNNWWPWQNIGPWQTLLISTVTFDVCQPFPWSVNLCPCAAHQP